MFVCDDCHTPECKRGEIEDFMRSRGKCEGCGTVASCRDCQGYKDIPLPPEYRTLIRDAEIFDGMTKEQKALTSRLYARINDLTNEKTKYETEQAERVRLLQLAIDGRREYAEGAEGVAHMMDMGQLLSAEADTLNAALKIVQGDPNPMYAFLPSWRWGEAGLS